MFVLCNVSCPVPCVIDVVNVVSRVSYFVCNVVIRTVLRLSMIAQAKTLFLQFTRD